MKHIKYIALGLVIGVATVVSAQNIQQLKSHEFIATIDSGTGSYMTIHKITDGDTNCYVMNHKYSGYSANGGISCVK